MAIVEITNITVYGERIRELARSPETYEFVRRVVEGEAERLWQAAPVRTGAGRASIRTRMVMGSDGWYGTASWDTSHYYMGLRNARTHWADRVAQQGIRYV